MSTDLPKDESYQFIDNQRSFDILIRLVNGYAFCFTPLLHSRHGVRSGRDGLFSLVGMCLYSGLCPQIVPYMGCWVVAVAFRRLTADKRQHSRYTGFPFLFGWAGEGKGKLLEAIAVGLVGYAWGGPMGDFIVGGGVALFAKEVITWNLIRADAIALSDAEVQTRQKLGRY